jgi:formylglycine-generating enzyme required for sulfatase activity
VDSFAANPWGLYQVHGNVYDWVEDCWNENYDGAPSDGSAWAYDGCHRHVLRGGSWARAPATLRAAARNSYGSETMRLATIGMRVARTIRH